MATENSYIQESSTNKIIFGSINEDQQRDKLWISLPSKYLGRIRLLFSVNYELDNKQVKNIQSIYLQFFKVLFFYYK